MRKRMARISETAAASALVAVLVVTGVAVLANAVIRKAAVEQVAGAN